jgi:hypothetical protein
MRRVIIMGLFLSMFIFSGCIVSSSPSGFYITMDKGDSLEFKTVVSPATSHVQWTLQYLGVDVDTATGLTYTFTPEMKGLYQMTLDVTESNDYGYNRTWVINVQ